MAKSKRQFRLKSNALHEYITNKWTKFRNSSKSMSQTSSVATESAEDDKDILRLSAETTPTYTSQCFLTPSTVLVPAFLTFTCLLLFSACNAVNISPRILDPGQQSYLQSQPQQTQTSNTPYGTNSNNNVVLNNNNNNNGAPVVEPDYSSYLHWFFYFSPITLSWLSSNIVPDIIAVPPPLPLLVGFDSKAAVYWGNDLTPSLVRNQPVFLHWPTQPGMLYTIVMATPDVTAAEKPSLVLWVVVNIPGTRVDRGDIIVEYPGAAPPRDTGKHRYVFLVFKQTSRIHTSGYPEVTRRQFENRANFDFHHFAMHFKLGYPIAGNFFLSEYDDYVPFIYKQLGV